MVHAKNYETVSTFVKVMQKKLWPLFSGHGVYSHISRPSVCDFVRLLHNGSLLLSLVAKRMQLS